MDAKPIVVIYLPPEFGHYNGRQQHTAMDLMEVLNNGMGSPPRKGFESNNYWKDYYWFCFYKETIREPEFKVFYEKDFTDVQYLELKQIVVDACGSLQSSSNIPAHSDHKTSSE